MPTSSQANILKGIDQGRNTSISYQFSMSPRRSDHKKKASKSKKQTCEVVKFDFHVESRWSNSLEGVFAYDNKTNSCRQLMSYMSPTRELGTPFMWDNQPNKSSFETEANHDSSDADSFINERPSDEIKAHFTTPSPSLQDNTKFPINPIINPKMELHRPIRILDIPGLPKTIDSLCSTTYDQHQRFKGKTKFTSSNNLVRHKEKSPSPTKSSLNCLCGVNSLLLSKRPVLTINNLDPMKVPPPSVIPYKRQGFTSNVHLNKKGQQDRSETHAKEEVKSVKTVKQTSLLQEVKQCVNWEKRVSPAISLRREVEKAAPTAVCFSLRKIFDFAHSDVKELIEFQFKTKVQALQYDPVSVRVAEPGKYDRWIVTLTSRADCFNAIHQGMTLDGDNVIIRLWDEVMHEEKVFTDNVCLDYPSRYRLQKEMHNQVLKNFLATAVQ